MLRDFLNSVTDQFVANLLRNLMMIKTHLNPQYLEKITVDYIRIGKLPKLTVADSPLLHTDETHNL